MRVTTKGQVTIPVEIRERFGFLPDTEVDFIIEHDSVRIVRATKPGRSRGDTVVGRLRGRAHGSMTTDEILALTREP